MTRKNTYNEVFLNWNYWAPSQLVISLFLLFSSMTNSLSHSLSLFICGCGH